MEDKSSLHKVNLTMLRKNARSKKDKTSGRKKPRVGDYDITPAPDSLKSTMIKDNDANEEKVSLYAFIQYTVTYNVPKWIVHCMHTCTYIFPFN